MNKKIISTVLAVCMVFGSAAALPHSDFVSTSGITASADNPVSGNYQYSVLSDGTVKITWYTSKAAVKSVTIPSTIAGRKVTAIGEQAFYEKHIGTITVPEGVKTIENSAFIGCTATTINIPSTVTTIAGSAFLKCESLKNINVSASNKTYASVDGALLNKAKTEFLICPAGKTTYTVPSGVTNVKEYSFWSCNKLKSVTFAASVKTIANKAIYYCGELLTINLGSGVTSDINWIADECPKLKNINVHKNNKVYSSVDGAVYNKNKTTLVKVPVNNDKLSIPSTVTEIASKLGSEPKEIFFVYGLNYADALSVSTVAAVKNAPIIYLKTNGELDKDTAAYLASLKKKGCVKNAYVIGGAGVISDDMMKKAGNALGLVFNKTITRVAGANRYATCVAVNNKFSDVLSGKSICIAKGLDFPDALAGGVFAAANKAPLFLADNKLTDEQTKYLKAKKASKLYVFGGTGAVPNSRVQSISASSK